MIIESSIKLRLGARVQVLQLVYSDHELIREQLVFGHVLRPASKEEYMEESHAIVREDKYFYYEIRLEGSSKGDDKKGNPKHSKQGLGQKKTRKS